jgi:hypothetical protein
LAPPPKKPAPPTRKPAPPPQEPEEHDDDQPSLLQRYGPLALAILVAQALIAWALFHFYIDAPTDTSEQDLVATQVVAPPTGLPARSGLPYYYISESLQNITANPAGTNSQRFIVLNVQLGLVAYDRGKKPPKDDFTDKLVNETDILDKIGRNTSKIRAIISKTVRRKTVAEFEESDVQKIEDEIARQLNQDVFKALFPVDEKNKKEVRVTEVIFSDIIIQ